MPHAPAPHASAGFAEAAAPQPARPGPRRRFGRHAATWALWAVAAAGGLGGCASLNTVESTVSSFGTWPAGRAPGRYAFDRLPSQQAPERLAERETLERLASQALHAAGFTPATTTEPADVLVQVGARVSRQQLAPWEDPFWTGLTGRRWPVTHAHHAARLPRHGSLYLGPSEAFQREVALLLRDRATGQALFETRASTDGPTEGGQALLGTMFKAAMQDFPNAQAQPHGVRVVWGP